MGEIQLNIQNPLYDKLIEMSKALKIDIEELCNLCLIDGYSLYWFLYEKKTLDCSDISNKELAHQFHEQYKLFQKIDAIEREFDNKYPYGYFNTNYERYKKFLDFINAYQSLEFMKAQEEIEKEEIKPSFAPHPKKIPKKKKKKKEQIKGEEYEKFSLGLFTERRVISFFLSLICTFIIFWAIWDYLDPIHVLRYTPYNLAGYIALIIFTLIIFGLLWSKILWQIRKYRENAPKRAENKMLKQFQEEFVKSNPKSAFKSETDWLNAYMEFLEGKKRAQPISN